MKNDRETNGASSPRVAVFASGTGSNFQAMLADDAIAQHIAILVCDKPEAPVLKIAEEQGISTFVFAPKEFESKTAYEQEIKKILHTKNIEWIFLAGYMRIIGEALLDVYEGKIVNIHPSFLPAFPGKDAIGQAMQANVTSTGVTVHYVDEGIDTGPIIEQEKVDIFPGESVEQLTTRIQQVEHKLYPKVIKQLLGVS